MAWQKARIVRRQQWAPGLMSVELDARLASFAPGQFVNLALELGGVRVRRPYSLASPPGKASEFYVAEVQSGAFTPELFKRTPDEQLWVEDRAVGFFTLDHVPPSPHLWLLATGTGLGPFLSMLRSEAIWTRHERVVLVHGVRYRSHLAYAAELRALVEARRCSFDYVPVVSRDETQSGFLSGRIPALLESRQLERQVGLPIEQTGSHILLCGNPGMIADVQRALAPRGLVKHRPRSAGQITFESYW